MSIRTIHLKTDPEGISTLNSEHQERGLFATIGYFSVWAIHSPRYCSLGLFVDAKGDIHATYRDEDGATTYIMFGQRSEEGTYTTHS